MRPPNYRFSCSSALSASSAFFSTTLLAVPVQFWTGTLFAILCIKAKLKYRYVKDCWVTTNGVNSWAAGLSHGECEICDCWCQQFNCYFLGEPGFGPYKPRTGRTGQRMNHAPAILAALALIYSMHRVLVVWIIVAHFHLCSLLGMVSRYTLLEVWAVRLPMHVCCGSRWGQCMLFVNILDSLTAPWLLYNTAMYTVCSRYGQYGRCVVNSLAGAAGVSSAAGAWFIWIPRVSRLIPWSWEVISANFLFGQIPFLIHWGGITYWTLSLLRPLTPAEEETLLPLHQSMPVPIEIVYINIDDVCDYNNQLNDSEGQRWCQMVAASSCDCPHLIIVTAVIAGQMQHLCCVPFKSWTRVHEFTTGEKAFHWRRDLVNS